MDIYLNALSVAAKHHGGIKEADLANAMTEGSIPERWEAIHHLKSTGEISDLGGPYKITKKGRERLRVDSAASRNNFYAAVGAVSAIVGIVYGIIELLRSLL